MIAGRLNMRLARPIVGARPRRNWVAPAVPTPAKIGKKNGQCQRRACQSSLGRIVFCRNRVAVTGRRFGSIIARLRHIDRLDIAAG